MSNQYVSIDPCNLWVGLSGIIIDLMAFYSSWILSCYLVLVQHCNTYEDFAIFNASLITMDRKHLNLQAHSPRTKICQMFYLLHSKHVRDYWQNIWERLVTPFQILPNWSFSWAPLWQIDAMEQDPGGTVQFLLHWTLCTSANGMHIHWTLQPICGQDRSTPLLGINSGPTFNIGILIIKYHDIMI